MTGSHCTIAQVAEEKQLWKKIEFHSSYRDVLLESGHAKISGVFAI
jgi:hypothetical protein